MSLTQKGARIALKKLVQHNASSPTTRDVMSFLDQRERATVLAFIGDSEKWKPIDVVECVAGGSIELPTPSNYTHNMFHAYMNEIRSAPLVRRALFAAWWFIENVPQDDPARTDIYFEVRELVRATL